jgi:hypothetical protein
MGTRTREGRKNYRKNLLNCRPPIFAGSSSLRVRLRPRAPPPTLGSTSFALQRCKTRTQRRAGCLRSAVGARAAHKRRSRRQREALKSQAGPEAAKRPLHSRGANAAALGIIGRGRRVAAPRFFKRRDYRRSPRRHRPEWKCASVSLSAVAALRASPPLLSQPSLFGGGVQRRRSRSAAAATAAVASAVPLPHCHLVTSRALRRCRRRPPRPPPPPGCCRARAS